MKGLNKEEKRIRKAESEKNDNKINIEDKDNEEDDLDDLDKNNEIKYTLLDYMWLFTQVTKNDIIN